MYDTKRLIRCTAIVIWVAAFKEAGENEIKEYYGFFFCKDLCVCRKRAALSAINSSAAVRMPTVGAEKARVVSEASM